MKLLTITRSFLFRILIFNLMLISVIIFVLSIILYLNFKSIGTKIVTESILDRLYQTSYFTNYLQDASLGVIAQVYMDDDVTGIMNNKNPEGTELYGLKIKLQRIVNASDFVDSISIYNGTGDNFFSTKDYSPESEEEYLFNYVNDKKRNDELGSGLHPVPRIITGTLTFNAKESIPVYSYIMYNKGDVRPEKAVILNVKEDWMRNVIKSAGANYLGNVFVIDQNGIVMSSISREMFLKDLSGRDYVKRVLHGGNTGYFTADVDNVPSLVTFVSSDTLGWEFISVLPFSTVVADIERIRNYTFSIGIAIFLLGIILSYILAKRVSFPIYNLKRKITELIPSDINTAGDIELITTKVNEAATKLRSLENMKEEKAVLEKEAFMRNLLLDLTDYKNVTDVKNNLSIDLEHFMMVIILKIDNFYELKKNSDIIDLNLLKFAICNIACEILSAVYAVEAVDTGEDHITLLINTRSDVQCIEEDEIRPYFIEIQKALLKYFKQSITVASGCISNNAGELGNFYKETLRSFEYRLILGHQSIITYNYVMSAQEKEYNYPENLENNMMEALKLFKKEQAEQIFHEIVNQAIGLGINALHSAIIRLVIAISNTTQLIKIYYDTVNIANMDVNTLIGKVNRMETLEQITAFFEECFQKIMDVLNEKRNNKTTILINEVKEYIQSNYVDTNLSLKNIADIYHITAAYLGKLFREYTGVSVSEYINEIRINEALKLLSESSMPINDIIEKTGSTISLFFRYFKKTYGITPNEYRKNMQKSNNI